jgi:membrane associated rhomboid family serine protease
MSWRNRLIDFLETAEDRLSRHAAFLAGWLALLWCLEWFDAGTAINLDRWGIQPHTWSGLAGVLAAPFLHAGFDHLAVNSVTLVALAWLTLLTGWRPFWIVTVLAGWGGGLAIWLTAREGTTHLGCSGLCFGYLGYLIVHGVLKRSVPWLILSAGVAIVYGSLATGLLPNGGAEISWEGHLFGLLFGSLAAGITALESSEPGEVRNADSGETESPAERK